MSVTVCNTGKDDKTRPPPAVKSSVFMQDSWTIHAYVMSHDGSASVVLLEDGIRILRGNRKDDYALPLNIGQRDYMWHPDCKRLAFWVRAKPKKPKPGELATERKALAILDITRLPPGPIKIEEVDKIPYEIVYWSSNTSSPFGIEWSPKGDAIFVVSTDQDPEDNQTYGVITRVELGGNNRSTEIVRVPGEIDFFMPPVSRFERGEGPSTSEYQIIYGHLGGLFVIGPEGKNLLQLAAIPANGLYNVEWNPSPRTNQVALFFRKAVQAPNGKSFKGVYLVDINKVGGAKGAATPAPEGAEAGLGPGIEELYDQTDIHTLWFSPKGKYVTWSGPRAVYFRGPTETPDKMVRVTIPTLPDGEDPLIKGVSWNDGEQKLAIAAGNRLYIYELATKELYPVAELGSMNDTFTAEPRWVGDQVWVSSYEDAIKSNRVQKPGTLQFGRPGFEKDPTQGRGSSSAGGAPAPTPGTTTDKKDPPKSNAPSGGVTNPPAGKKNN